MQGIIEDIGNRQELEVASLALHWLGQSGFLINAPGGGVLIDPWFSPHELRERPAPDVDALPGRVAWLLATHEHGDHLDLPALPALTDRHRGLRVVVPSPLAARVRAAAPGAAVIGVQPGETISGQDLRIRAVRAWHGVTIDDGYSDGRGPDGAAETAFCGYVISLDGLVIYHAGDTVLGDGMTEELGPLGIDVALLPVNGRDATREAMGILGNLWPHEAVGLAAAIGARVLVPMHFDMVRGNTIEPGSVLASAARTDGAPEVMIPDRSLALPLPKGRLASQGRSAPRA